MDGEWKWAKVFLQYLVFLDAECLCAIHLWEYGVLFTCGFLDVFEIP